MSGLHAGVGLAVQHICIHIQFIPKGHITRCNICCFTLCFNIALKIYAHIRYKGYWIEIMLQFFYFNSLQRTMFNVNKMILIFKYKQVSKYCIVELPTIQN